MKYYQQGHEPSHAHQRTGTLSGIDIVIDDNCSESGHQLILWCVACSAPVGQHRTAGADGGLRPSGDADVPRRGQSDQEPRLDQRRRAAEPRRRRAAHRRRPPRGQGHVPVFRPQRPGERPGLGRTQTRRSMSVLRSVSFSSNGTIEP